MSVVKALQEEEKYEQFKEDWTDFHGKNHHIYHLFDKMVRIDIQELEDKGLLFIRKIPLRRIFENIKWAGITTTCSEGYLINNNYYKIYAFQWEANNPEYIGIFQHRGYMPLAIAKLHQEQQGRLLLVKKRYERRKTKQQYSKSRVQTV